MLEALIKAIFVMAIVGGILSLLLLAIAPIIDLLADDPEGAIGGCGCLIAITLVIAAIIYFV